MRLAGPTNSGNLKTLEDLIQYVSQMINAIRSAVNGNISFYDNINCNIQSVVFSTANQDVAITHNLGRVATNYVLCGSDVATQLYNGIQSPERNVLYLRASVAASATVIIF